jgi:hypothetical protein
MGSDGGIDKKSGKGHEDGAAGHGGRSADVNDAADIERPQLSIEDYSSTCQPVDQLVKFENP